MLSYEALTKQVGDMYARMALEDLTRRDPLLDLFPKRPPPTRWQRVKYRVREWRERVGKAWRVLRGEELDA